MKYASVIILLVAASIYAQQSVRSSSTNAWMTESERTSYETLRRSGLDALFNLEYDKARADFKEITRLLPNHPAGYQLQAAGLWAKTLYESRRLQSSLYNSGSFYANGDDKVDPKIIDEFRSLTRDAKRFAEARLKQDPKNIEALDFLAATQGLKAAFEETVERRHLAALRDSNDAVDHHREVLKLDPHYVDAQMTIGLYEYVVGSLPPLIKIVAGVTGYHGSKKKGLALIEQVSKEGRWSQDDAKSLLIVLYTREKRFADILPLTRELSSKYPRNYLYKLETSDALVALAAQRRKANDPNSASQAEKEAFASFDELLRDRNVRAVDLVHFKYGEALLVAGQNDRAAKEYLAVTKVERAEPGLVTMAHLYAGHAFDLAGRREEALVQYREVLARPDVYDAHDEAKKGLQKAYKPETVAKSEGQ